MQKKFLVGRYGGWALLFFVILGLGILISALKGQPIVLGIKAVKFYSLFLIYFYVVNHEVNIDRFVKYFIVLALVIAGLVILQLAFQNHIRLFPARNVDAVRSFRIIEGSFLISTAIVLAFSTYLQKREKFHLYAFCALLAHLVFVVQTRMLIAGVILTCVIIYFIYNRFSIKSIAALVLVMFIVSFVVISYVPVSEIPIVERTMVDFDDDKETGSTILARVDTYKYYLEKLAKSPVFGYGFQYLLWRGNEEILLQRKGLHLSDVGIMGFTIKTGLVGLIWLASGLLRFMVHIIKAKELHSGAYIILGIMTLASIDLIMGEKSIFMFGLFLGLMSNEYTQSQSRDSYA